MTAGADFGFETNGDEVVATFGHFITDKTVLITGGSVKGLGASAAIALAAKSPAHIILTARSEGKIPPVFEEIKKKSPSTKTTFIPVKLNDFKDVRRAAADINAGVEKIDVLINNAGVMAIPYERIEGTILEMTFATNHLGPFLLTGLLMDKVLTAASGSRIVNVSSSCHRFRYMRYDYNFSDGKTYDPWLAYGQSKTTNILHVNSLSKYCGPAGVTAVSVHPGGIYNTSLTSHLNEETLNACFAAAESWGGKHVFDPPKTHQQGIATMLVASLIPEIPKYNGCYIKDCQVTGPVPHARSEEDVERL
ncbi:putative short-chain dehydrogenase [Massarina eburnea CBS 473.64]|uniref:Putative short-chain dehydrogenase n=1 Tax=Massarina eburnea CBS 473.64 TaxID=1395130 RepID=A0A6A6SCM2_9PLEO|nr:putative short-chain dehydrogenase [Massarina eburnea CBS 473.64]